MQVIMTVQRAGGRWDLLVPKSDWTGSVIYVKLTDGNMRWNLCFPDWVAENIFLDDFPGSRGTGMRGPLTSEHSWTATIINNTITPSLILFPRLMARLSGATPGARVVPCCSCGLLQKRLRSRGFSFLFPVTLENIEISILCNPFGEA